jgi:hypothetical protein
VTVTSTIREISVYKLKHRITKNSYYAHMDPLCILRRCRTRWAQTHIIAEELLCYSLSNTVRSCRWVAVSISDCVIGIFHWHNPSGRTVALGLTQPLTEMSTRMFPEGLKVSGAYGWQPYHPHVPIFLKSGSLNLLEPSGPVQACIGIALPFCFLFCTKLFSFSVLLH